MKKWQQSALVIATGMLLWGCASHPTADGLVTDCEIPDRLWDGQIFLAVDDDVEAQIISRLDSQKTNLKDAEIGRERACNDGFCMAGAGWLSKDGDYCIDEGSSLYSEAYGSLDIRGPARGTLRDYGQVTACSVHNLDCPTNFDSIIGHVESGRATVLGEMCSHGHCISRAGWLNLAGGFCIEENARLYSKNGDIDIHGPLLGNLLKQSDCRNIHSP